MITLILITLACGVAIYRLAPRKHVWAWLGALVGTALLLSFGLEVLVRGTDFFVSDERGYIELGRVVSLGSLSDRYLWILLNAVVLRYDVSLSGLPLKLLNLPLLALQVTLLWRIFDRHRLIWWIPVFLPYIAYVATMNLRDTAILTATAACVCFLDSRRIEQRILFVPAVGALYLLRPFIAIASTAVWFGILAFPTLRRLVKGRIAVRALVLASGSILVLSLVFGGQIVNRAERYYAWYEYTTGEGLSERVAERGLDDDAAFGFSGRRVAMGAARYTLAPLPTSLFLRILEGGSRRWGVVDDTVRMLHQTAYYFLLAWLVVNWRHWIPMLKTLKRGQIMLLTALVLYFPIYSVYLFGVSHQRLKIPFQLAVALVAIVTLRSRELNGSAKHHDGLEDEGTRVR